MTRITKEEVLKIARMSYISVNDHEVEPLRKQLEQVLSYAQRVAEVTTQDYIYLYKLENIVRDDISIMSDSQVILEQAPDREGDFFVVPAILDSQK